MTEALLVFSRLAKCTTCFLMSAGSAPICWRPCGSFCHRPLRRKEPGAGTRPHRQFGLSFLPLQPLSQVWFARNMVRSCCWLSSPPLFSACLRLAACSTLKSNLLDEFLLCAGLLRPIRASHTGRDDLESKFVFVPELLRHDQSKCA